MMKAGVIDEMMSDAIDDAVDGDDVEQETDAEVDKVHVVLAKYTEEVVIPANNYMSHRHMLKKIPSPARHPWLQSCRNLPRTAAAAKNARTECTSAEWK